MGINIVLGKEDIDKLLKKKSEAKKLANKVDFFIAQPDLMVTVGKTLGPILGPRNKMPRPVPPKADLKPILERFNKLVLLRLKNQPVLHCLVGTEDMEDEKVAENVEAVLNAIAGKLPKGEKQIASVHVKLTMGPSVRVL